MKEWLNQIDLVVIGQALPILDGIGDWLESLGIEVISPTSKNTLIEASKSYMRDFLTRNEIDGYIYYSACYIDSYIINFIGENLEFVENLMV